MSILKDYEKRVVQLLTAGVLSKRQIEALNWSGEFVGYEYTGCGYFLSIRHPSLPKERIVCHKPMIIGQADDIICGFVIFIEDGQFTLECHSFGEIDVPEWFRDRNVQVALA